MAVKSTANYLQKSLDIVLAHKYRLLEIHSLSNWYLSGNGEVSFCVQHS